MKLGSKSRYAVIAMVDVSLHNHLGTVKLYDIAKRQNLPIQYLEQLFSKLRKVGLIKSTRGSKGGYNLLKSSEEITVFEIISAVEEHIQTTRCEQTSNDSCQCGETKCLTHALWVGFNNHIINYLETVTLDHICKNKISIISEKLTGYAT